MSIYQFFNWINRILGSDKKTVLDYEIAPRHRVLYDLEEDTILSWNMI